MRLGSVACLAGIASLLDIDRLGLPTAYGVGSAVDYLAAGTRKAEASCDRR